MPKIKLKILLLPLFAIKLLMTVNGYGTIVGGKTPIPDVKNNKGIQSLGLYAVKERNKGLTEGGEVLVFCDVVEAEQQVVSGIQYFLKIEATEKDEQKKMFDSVVLVKPWTNTQEKELISFSASAQQPEVVAGPPPAR